MPDTYMVAELLKKRGVSDPELQIRLMDAIEAILVASLLSGVRDRDAAAVFGTIIEMFNCESKLKAQAAHVH